MTSATGLIPGFRRSAYLCAGRVPVLAMISWSETFGSLTVGKASGSRRQMKQTMPPTAVSREIFALGSDARSST